MGFLSEFKEFAAKGNVMDLAVGVIIGGAFGKIVTSVVEDLIMPVVSLATGKVNLSEKFVALDGNSYETIKAAKDKGAAAIAYGNFVNNVVHFLIVAFCVFLIVKAINSMKRKEEKVEAAVPTEPPAQEKLLAEIRDLLKSGKA